MSDSARETTEADVLAVFEERSDPREPLATSEVAAAVGCDRRTAYECLSALGERGTVESKRIGPRALAWWRPSPGGDRRPGGGPADGRTEAPPIPGDGSIIERILEASPVSIVAVDASGAITFANGRAEETLGLERDEITGRSYRQPEWNIYREDGTPIADDEHPVTRVLETGEADFGFEHWIELEDGTERWLSSNSAPVLDDEGAVEYVVVGFEDATDLKEREDKLTSDRVRSIELASEALFRPFLAAADGAVRVDVDEVVSLSDGTALQYVTATGVAPKALVGAFERQESVLGTRLLSSTDERTRLEVHVEPPTIPLAFEELGGHVDSLVRTRADGAAVLTGVLPGDVDARTAVRSARRGRSDLELVSQELHYSPRLLYDVVEGALTERQFAALQTAYYGGYFDDPRTSTGDELAARLGVTRQTFNYHLRRAERTVLEQLFEASGKAAR